MSKNLAELCKYINSFVASHPSCTKDQLQKATAEQFSLIQQRSVFSSEAFAIRFSSVRGATFANCVISLSALQKYDRAPFVVCVVRPSGVELLIANSTFLKKISHSSHQLRIDNVRGTFLGHDIFRVYDGIENRPENFEELFGLHSQFAWEENLARLVERTTAIAPTGVRFEPSVKQKVNILRAPEIAKLLSQDPEYVKLGDELARIVRDNAGAILEVATTDINNINLRGNKIEQIITSTGNFHALEDVSHTLTAGTEVKVDIKTKILTLSSSPKGYNIDKILKVLATGNSAFSFFFVGINLEQRSVVTRLVSILDELILNSTTVKFHWAGRNSRGVTQLSGNLGGLFDPHFSETIEVERAREFLAMLIDIEPVVFES
jgi:hypothetical protein